jgi:hypothetical protein
MFVCGKVLTDFLIVIINSKYFGNMLICGKVLTNFLIELIAHALGDGKGGRVDGKHG